MTYTFNGRYPLEYKIKCLKFREERITNCISTISFCKRNLNNKQYKYSYLKRLVRELDLLKFLSI